MAKTYSGQDFALGLNIKATKPLDSRDVIDTAADRLLPQTWLADDGNYYVYAGMTTRCADTGASYVYIGRANNPTDIADSSKWIATGGNIDAMALFAQMCAGITQAQYDSLSEYQSRLYFVKSDRGRLLRIYYGGTLVARRADESENISLGFPYEIPVLF